MMSIDVDVPDRNIPGSPITQFRGVVERLNGSECVTGRTHRTTSAIAKDCYGPFDGFAISNLGKMEESRCTGAHRFRSRRSQRKSGAQC